MMFRHGFRLDHNIYKQYTSAKPMSVKRLGIDVELSTEPVDVWKDVGLSWE